MSITDSGPADPDDSLERIADAIEKVPPQLFEMITQLEALVPQLTRLVELASAVVLDEAVHVAHDQPHSTS